MDRLVLASKSVTRADMLRSAGVPFEAMTSGLDEAALKEGLAAEGIGPRDLADALAEAKARRLSQRLGGDAKLVLGADQTGEDAAGALIGKPASRDAARSMLTDMSGKTHRLHSAAVIAIAGSPVWRHVESVTMHVRKLSAAFIDGYVDAEWETIRHCAGSYAIEGAGAQLFARVEGSHFAILGLPLLPLLDHLRVREVLKS